MAERRDDEELRGKFTKLYNAVRDGNLDETEVILESLSPGALNWKIQDKDQTALHTAVTHGHVHIVEALVMQMSNEGLAMYDSDGHTALTLAVVLGKWGMVECMLRQYFDLISIRHSEGKNLPVVMAIDFRHIEMARQLYYLTPDKDLIPQDNNQEIQDRNGATLFTRAIYTGTLDIALGLILTCPRLALALDKDDESPILALASIRHSFPSGIQLGFCKQRIYSCMRISFAPPISDTRLNVSNGEQRQSNQEDQNIISVLSRSCAVGVLNFFGITQLYEMKKIHDQYNELLSHMCEVISSQTDRQLKDGRVYSAISRAAQNGISEFVSEMLKTDLRFIWVCDEDERNIFMLAVLHRQEKIFSILYDDTIMGKYNAMKCLLDVDGNNILHMAGMIEHSTRVNQIPGAALQMQRELQWFKEVERIVHPKDKETTNEDGLTPRQLFTKKHENMMEKGEKWMKDTARSCTVVGALIVTIMFAAAFTIPGVVFFSWIQFPILKDMIISTYGPSIFDRKMKLMKL
ncbi:hypothetical protein F2P56_010646 [Juglans regia]|uniref:Uncharacterized protein LOC109015675 isoform X3 n=2 Tax=Juglans regia TaxID=51240 RepID=A0A6P9ECU3_JUGRE|nr:uncharacterized protein LOC109015675 isoform X3 [Juglans regia]KAF5470104.1 hypothetical protein F2P56_010646 [Juglans regia]